MNIKSNLAAVAQPNAVSPHTKWAEVGLLTAGLGVDKVARLATFSTLPLVQQELRLNDVVIGLLAASFLWPYGLLSPVAGFIGDRFSLRTVIIASLSIWNAGRSRWENDKENTDGAR